MIAHFNARSLRGSMALLGACLAMSLTLASTALAGDGPIAAGDQFACTASDGSGVKCVGWGTNGQLGDGHWLDRWTWEPVLGITGAASDVAAGRKSACAIQGGAVSCWGHLPADALKPNGTAPAARATAVAGIAGATDIDVGSEFQCAVAGGAAKCWGFNSMAQLGDGTSDDSNTPVDVQGLSAGVTAISAGHTFTCAVVSGIVECWGDNRVGQIGNGRKQSREYDPQPVAGIAGGAQDVGAGGDFGCALVSGSVLCWGNNTRGQLGNGTRNSSLVPVPVDGMQGGVTQLAVGVYHACAVKNSVASCWGYNEYGGLGNRSEKGTTRPVAVKDYKNFTAISAGSIESCGVSAGKTVCWGGGFDPIVKITSAPRSVKLGAPIKIKVKGAVMPYAIQVLQRVNGKRGRYAWSIAVKRMSSKVTLRLPSRQKQELRDVFAGRRGAKVELLLTPAIGVGKARTKTVRLRR